MPQAAPASPQQSDGTGRYSYKYFTSILKYSATRMSTRRPYRTVQYGTVQKKTLLLVLVPGTPGYGSSRLLVLVPKTARTVPAPLTISPVRYTSTYSYPLCTSIQQGAYSYTFTGSDLPLPPAFTRRAFSFSAFTDSYRQLVLYSRLQIR